MSKSQFFKNAFLSAAQTMVRFPFETLTSIIALVISILYTNEQYDSELLPLYKKIILTCSLSLVGFLSVSLYFSARKKEILWLVSSLSIAGFLSFFVFSFSEKLKDTEMVQYFVLNLALHLLVSFVAFLSKPYNQNQFWEFNKKLFLRFLTAGLYSFVLFGGLSLALLAVTELFGLKLYNKIYLHLWLVIAIGFNTLFFLAGIPDLKNKETELELNYPMGLKKFTLYVLLPLLLLYLVILLGYEAKIIALLTLPVGWVSNLILVFSLFGIFSFLLLHPIAHQAENRWIYSFNRWFYFVLIPLIGLLFWAILYRINWYGITHGRYYVLLLAVWLTIVVLYFIFYKQAKIRFIPVSLFVAALFSIAGPQSANSVSKSSQLARFERYISILEKKKLSFSQEKELSSIVDFLESNYGLQVMQPLVKGKLDELAKVKYTVGAQDIMLALGVNYVRDYELKPTNEFHINYYNYNSNALKKVQGFDFILDMNQYDRQKFKDTLLLNNQKISIQTKEKEYGFDLILNGKATPIDILSFVDLKKNEFITINSERQIIQHIHSPYAKIQLEFKSVEAQIKKENNSLQHFDIKMFVTLK